jgi:phage terminase small subunit
MPRGGKRPNAGRKHGPTARTKAIRERLLKDVALSAESTIEAIRRGAQYDIRAFFDANGNLRPLKELSEAEAWAVAGFEVVIKNVTAGDGQQDTVAKIKLVDRSKYVDMAAKHFGLLIDKVEHSGGITITHELPE